MKAIYKFKLNYGRSGDLHGSFVADTEDVKKLIDSKIDIYFGSDILGKHSEVNGTVEEHELTLITDDPDLVEKFEYHNMSVGFNPFDYEEVKELLGTKESTNEN